MKDFDAVVFDMDGLIFDSERVGYICWSEVLAGYGVHEITELYNACIGCSRVRTARLVREALGEDFPFEEFIRKVLEIYTTRYGGGKMPIKPGAREILSWLKTKGKKTALASSSGRETVVSLLGAAGLLEYFDGLVCGDMVTKSKPEPDIFLSACELLGTAPERTFAVEDSYNGIRAAARGGLRPVMVPDMLPATEEMRGLSEAVEDDLYGVIGYFAGNNDSE
ncbi:MAG: HAD family phosphatase [Lachnospiraceae bacterium]|nr:HAD family phosphatase [Lachnospiraceae bacterium]